MDFSIQTAPNVSLSIDFSHTRFPHLAMSEDQSSEITPETSGQADSSSESSGASSSLGKIIGIVLVAVVIAGSVIGYTFWQTMNEISQRKATIVPQGDPSLYESESGGDPADNEVSDSDDSASQSSEEPAKDSDSPEA